MSINFSALLTVLMIVLTEYGYVTMETFNYFLIFINVIIILGFYGLLDMFNTINKVYLMEHINEKTYNLIYQLNKLDSRFFRNIIIIPLMLFFSYISYMFTAFIWMFFLIIDELIRTRTEKILMTKKIYTEEVDEPLK